MKLQVIRRKQTKQLRAIQTSRHLHVSHHRHTGRVLPRSNTSYPMLVMILLLVGVFLAEWTHYAAAGPSAGGDYKVKASVPGPAPPRAAVITSPLNGSSDGRSPITVRGTCDPGTYVKLIRNQTPSGVAMCSADGHFAVVTGLFHGGNVLLVQVYNFANVAGPDSAPVTINYTGFDTPLVIKNDYQVQGVYTGRPVSWTLGLDGGSPPYALDVEWGDGSHDVYSLSAPGGLQLTHVYHRHGGYRGNYTIQITMTDVNGKKAYLQLFAIINDLPSNVTTPGNGSTSSSTTPSQPGGLAGLGHYILPSYAISVLMLLSFWLGERHELKFIRPRLKRPRHI